MNGVTSDLASYMYQDVGTLQANTTYTFTVALGWRNDQGVGSINLGFVNGSTYAFGDSFLAESSSFLATTQGGFSDVTFSYTTGAVVAGDLTLVIRNPTPGAPTSIDNIRLDAVAVPEPSSIALLGVGATALLILRRKRSVRG